jgi:hypothetical protein
MHFEGGEEISGWFFVKDFDEMKSTFKLLVERFKNETPLNRQFRPILKNSMKKYLFQDEHSYAQRLDEAVRLVSAMK